MAPGTPPRESANLRAEATEEEGTGTAADAAPAPPAPPAAAAPPGFLGAMVGLQTLLLLFVFCCFTRAFWAECSNETLKYVISSC